MDENSGHLHCELFERNLTPGHSSVEMHRPWLHPACSEFPLAPISTPKILQQPVNAQDEFMPVYAAHLRGIIQRGVDDKEHPEQPLRGFHIVVDAGNGGGGYFATDVLESLGANTEGRLSRCPYSQRLTGCLQSAFVRGKAFNVGKHIVVDAGTSSGSYSAAAVPTPFGTNAERWL